jgi:protocatechuate 3,4-dioxygenase beta subunit
MSHPMNRRNALAAFGTVGVGALLAACGGSDSKTTTTATVPTTEGGTATVSPQSTPSPATTELFDGAATCTATREMTEGPYYFDANSIRSDLREDRAGTALRLAVRVQDSGRCAPLANAVVDIWHCDAAGLYSGFESASRGNGRGRTDEETYLRGAQVTNADGIVQFMTVYPGWYRGRTVHIHVKVHVDSDTVLTTQFFFDEDVTRAVYAKPPYANKGAADTSNSDDRIYDDSLVLTLKRDGAGYLGVMTVAV